MQTNNGQQHNTHAHLAQKLSAVMVQITALQALVRDEHAPDDTATPPVKTGGALFLDTIRNGLAALEQMTRETLYELRSMCEDEPLPELAGVTLAEALSRAIEETAEAAGLSSRVAISGEEHSLSNYSAGLLYRVAQEALYQVQQHTEAHRLRLILNYRPDDVYMSIEDDGVAAPPAQEDSTYLPFLASQPAVTDVVISDLRHHIELLGGSLEISASAEEGTRVRVHLPYVQQHTGEAIAATETRDAASRPQDTTAPAQPVTMTERVRVLVVEGQAVTRAGLRRLLESYPDLQVVGEAADGLQAVSETLELGPQVVLMDMQLPNGQSLEALRQIRQLNLNTRVLLLSALDREDYLYETLRAGAGGYVLKDIAPDELAEAVRTVARGEVPVQPQLARRLFSQFGQQGRGGHPYEALTAREQEVLRLLARGLRNKEMAARLHVSERTINFHLANIYQKLNVSGRTEALSKALEQGLITA